MSVVGGEQLDSGEARRLLAGLGGLRSLATGTLSADELRGLISETRVAQRELDSLVTRAGMALSRLNEGSGGSRVSSSAGVTDAMRGEGGKVGASTARRDAARAETAALFDDVEDAVEDGELSGEHLDCLARGVRDLSAEERSRLDMERLLADARRLPVDVFNRRVRDEVRRVQTDHGLADAVAKQKASRFRHWFDKATGMGRFTGALDPERYEILAGAIEAATRALSDETGAARDENLAAAALVELVAGGVRSGRRADVSVVVDAATLANGFGDDTVCETGNGHGLAPEQMARLLCDAVLRRVVLGLDGVPIDVGRRYRTATDAQWKAITAIHATCAWNGCDAPISWCQLHHIHEWEHGGPTDLNNLVPLCSRHHHIVHEGRWTIRLAPDRLLSIYRPDGAWHATTRPDRQPRPVQRE